MPKAVRSKGFQFGPNLVRRAEMADKHLLCKGTHQHGLRWLVPKSQSDKCYGRRILGGPKCNESRAPGTSFCPSGGQDKNMGTPERAQKLLVKEGMASQAICLAERRRPSVECDSTGRVHVPNPLRAREGTH